MEYEEYNYELEYYNWTYWRGNWTQEEEKPDLVGLLKLTILLSLCS